MRRIFILPDLCYVYLRLFDPPLKANKIFFLKIVYWLSKSSFDFRIFFSITIIMEGRKLGDHGKLFSYLDLTIFHAYAA